MAMTPPLSHGKQSPSPDISLADRLPPTPPPESASSSTVGLCIAHYNEDLTWLQPYASDTAVYSKGPDPPSQESFSKTVRLPNIGRETHTYLHHIANNYHSLPSTTLFLQGDIHSVNEGTPAHTDLTLTELVSLASRLSPGAVLPIGHLHTFSSWDAIPYKPDWVRRRGATLVRSKHTPGQFWTEVLFPASEACYNSPASSSAGSSRTNSSSTSSSTAFPTAAVTTTAQTTTPPEIPVTTIPNSSTTADPTLSSSNPAEDSLTTHSTPPTRTPISTLPKQVRFVQGACFAVTREAIRRRPHAWWARMLAWFEELGELNPEEGHYMERFWWAVFDEGVAVLR